MSLLVTLTKTKRVNSVPDDNFTRDTNNGGIWRNVPGDPRTGADFGIMTYCYIAQNLGPGADYHIITDGRVAFAFGAACPTQGNPLTNKIPKPRNTITRDSTCPIVKNPIR